MFDFIKVDAATYVDGITCKIKWTIIFDMNYLVSIESIESIESGIFPYWFARLNISNSVQWTHRVSIIMFITI